VQNLRIEEAILLGFIQGITEWLPISSSGHLALTQVFLGLKEVPIFFDVMLHFGTLLVVLAFFRQNIADSIREWRKFKYEREGKFLIKVLLGVVPTALVGIVVGEVLKQFFTDILAVSAALLITGSVLFASKHVEEGNDEVGFHQAFLIGVAQGISLIPGISRSGFTIAVGLLLGIKREEAFKFSFTIFVPAVLGALAKTFLDETEHLGMESINWVNIIAGTLIAVVIGYFSLKLLAKTLKEKSFHLFAYYCWSIGAILIIAKLLFYPALL